jgi:hypothetical protein
MASMELAPILPSEQPIMRSWNASVTSRREWLSSLIGLGTGAALSGCSPRGRHSVAQRGRAVRGEGNLVRLENQTRGDK